MIYKDDLELLHEIQKNAEYLSKDIKIVTQMIDDNQMELELSKQNLDLSTIAGKAAKEVLDSNGKIYHDNVWSDIRQKNRLKKNTLFNISNSHIADIMIRENQNCITNMWLAKKHCHNASVQSMEIAQEFLDIEKKIIKSLIKYL